MPSSAAISKTGNLNQRPTVYRYSLFLIFILILTLGVILSGLAWLHWKDLQHTNLLNNFHRASAESSGKIEKGAANLLLRIRVLGSTREAEKPTGKLPSIPDTGLRYHNLVGMVEDVLQISRPTLEHLDSNEKQFGDRRARVLLDQLAAAIQAINPLIVGGKGETAGKLDTLLKFVGLYRLRAEQINRYHLAAYERISRNSAVERERLSIVITSILVALAIIVAALVVKILGIIKRSEEALKESQARFSEIISIAPGAIIAVGEDMNIQLFNYGAERMFDYGADEIVGEEARFVHQGMTSSDVLDTCLAVLNSGHVVYYPPAFSADSIERLRAEVGGDQWLIAAGEEDASRLGVNLVNIGAKVVMAVCSAKLERDLNRAGFQVAVGAGVREGWRRACGTARGLGPLCLPLCRQMFLGSITLAQSMWLTWRVGSLF